MFAIEIRSVTDIVLFSLLLLALCFIAILARRIYKLEKKEKKNDIEKRLKLLEKELDEYITRSKKRLMVFKKVVDGVDNVIQNIKTAIDDEDVYYVGSGSGKYLDNDDVIHIDDPDNEEGGS